MHAQPRILKRLAIGCLLAFAFLFMASVFVPDWTRADDTSSPSTWSQPLGASVVDRSDELGPVRDMSRFQDSIDLHAEHPALGEIASRRYTVRMYAASPEPLYSVYDNRTEEPLGVLLTADEVAERFTDLDLNEIDFSATTHLMLHMPADSPLED